MACAASFGPRPKLFQFPTSGQSDPEIQWFVQRSRRSTRTLPATQELDHQILDLKQRKGQVLAADQPEGSEGVWIVPISVTINTPAERPRVFCKGRGTSQLQPQLLLFSTHHSTVASIIKPGIITIAPHSLHQNVVPVDSELPRSPRRRDPGGKRSQPRSPVLLERKHGLRP